MITVVAGPYFGVDGKTLPTKQKPYFWATQTFQLHPPLRGNVLRYRYNSTHLKLIPVGTRKVQYQGNVTLLREAGSGSCKKNISIILHCIFVQDTEICLSTARCLIGVTSLLKPYRHIYTTICRLVRSHPSKPRPPRVRAAWIQYRTNDFKLTFHLFCGVNSPQHCLRYGLHIICLHQATKRSDVYDIQIKTAVRTKLSSKRIFLRWVWDTLLYISACKATCAPPWFPDHIIGVLVLLPANVGSIASGLQVSSEPSGCAVRVVPGIVNQGAGKFDVI